MMLRLATLLVVVIPLVAASARTSAQEANSEPGYCAQFYPNADCNTGPDAPKAGVRRAATTSAAPKRKPRAQTTAASPK